MTEPKDIIGIVKELQKTEVLCRDYCRSGLCQCGPGVKESAICTNCRSRAINARKIQENFPALAQALIERDEKLKVAVEALGVIVKMETISPTHTANDALSRIRAL